MPSNCFALEFRVFPVDSLYSDYSGRFTGPLSRVLSQTAPNQPLCYHERHDLSGSGGNVIDFKGRHFERETILQSVRWYLAYSLNYRDIEEIMKERGFELED